MNHFLIPSIVVGIILIVLVGYLRFLSIKEDKEKVISCPDCGEKMEIKTHTMFDMDQNDIDLEFPVCQGCGHIMYDTNY